ncbi:protein trichome birefringence-like 42 [Papaver somniferum]|uniref:protein trichome birefringence-like 42 n=1 Tax=Papaver somniferum TaxID=3469 RepID=UPI000E6FCBA8|nr:protein trichome birefringence-like 42 [Papaver somniferum]
MELHIRGYHNVFLLLVVSYYFLVLNHICAQQMSSAGRLYPLYDSSKCPWVSESFLCVPNGRPDKDYLKYRWSPSGCDAPRFDAEDFLRRYTGKKIMFVGDSISNNQWQSLTYSIWDKIQEENKSYKDLDRLVAFTKGLTTWSKWVDNNIDPKKTQVFYQGISPAHLDGNDWGSPGTNCANHTTPINGTVYPGSPTPVVAVVKQVLSRMSVHVNLLDITTSSQLRIDGHPSIYANRGQTAHDCGHWCLAGVPDTWNSLFYASVVLSENV